MYSVLRSAQATSLHARARGVPPGITRGIVLELAREAAFSVAERNVSLAELYTAEEVFTSGTIGGLAPVFEIDGRAIGDGAVGPVTRDLHARFTALAARRHADPALTAAAWSVGPSRLVALTGVLTGHTVPRP